MNTTELAKSYVSEFGACEIVDSEWAGTAFTESFANEKGIDFEDFQEELNLKVARESVPEATETQISNWKSRLPDTLTFGTFEEDFKVEGRFYRYGAWNSDGVWWLVWNSSEEFEKQIEQAAA